METDHEIVIKQASRPIGQLFFASIFYTLGILLIYKYVIAVSENMDPKYVKGAGGLLYLSAMFFVFAIKLSSVKTVFLNLKKEKLRTNLSIGFVSINYHSNIPDLDYISVFKNEAFFEVNLWCKKNKHFNIASFDNNLSAMNFALLFSNKLNVDLLDATEKGNSKWIDKAAL